MDRCFEDGAAARPLNRRGVAFLFQAYLITFWFIVLVGAMMMRSSAELEQARFGIETQQAFWMAETGVDELTYRLKLTPPTLSANQCTAPVLRLTNWAGPTYDFLGTAPFSNGTFNPATTHGYTAQVCLRPAGEYQIASVGMGSLRAAEVATTVTNIPNQNLQFNYAVLAPGTITTQHSTVDSVQGGYDDHLLLDLINNVPPNQTMFTSKGHLATLAQGRPAQPVCDDVIPIKKGLVISDEEVDSLGGTDCVGGRFINLLKHSAVKGNMYVSPHVTEASSAVYDTSTPPSQVTSLAKDVTLPQAVAPPAGTTDLGDTLDLRGVTATIVSGGIYKANKLILKKDRNNLPSRLLIGQPVDLYVTGNVIQEGGELYGTERRTHFVPGFGTMPYDAPVPAALRIIVLRDPDMDMATPQVNLSGGITGAVIYATGEIPITMTNHTLVGAAIGKQVTIDNSSVYYDQSLTGTRFTVNSSDPIAITELFKLKRVPLDQYTNQFLVGQVQWNPWAGTPQQNSMWVWLPTYGGWWSWDAYTSGRYTGPPPPLPGGGKVGGG